MTKRGNRAHKILALEEQIKFHSSLDIIHCRSRRKTLKSAGNARNSHLRLCLVSWRFYKPRTQPTSPRQYEAKATIFSRLRCRKRKARSELPNFRASFLSLQSSIWLPKITHALKVARRSSQYRFDAMKWPEERFGFGGDAERKKKLSREGSGLSPSWSNCINLNQTAQIFRWFDLQLRSLQRISYFLKIFFLIFKLPKIKTNSSSLWKFLRKFLQTLHDMYFNLEFSNWSYD